MEFSDGVSLTIAFLALVIAYIDVLYLLKRNRASHFNKVLSEVRQNRFTCSMWSSNKYEEYLEGKGKEGFTFHHLIVPVGWTREGLFVPTDRIETVPKPFNDSKTELKVYKSRFPAFGFLVHDFPDRGTYSDNLIRTGQKSISDGRHYKTVGVTSDNSSTEDFRIRIDMESSSYLDYIDTCEYRSYKVTRFKLKAKKGAKFRDWRKADLFYDLLDFTKRSADIGVCSLTVLNNVDGKEDNNYFLVHKRSDRVLEAPNVVSLVPAGSLQPTWKESQSKDLSDIIGTDMIRRTMIREFEEEVLDRSEVEFPYDYQVPEELESMDTYYLTMGFDPLTTKIEMVTAIVIDCANPEEKFLRYIGIDHNGPIKMKDIEKIVKNCSNEGSILIRKLNEANLKGAEMDLKTMPVFGECMWCMDKILDKYPGGFP